MHSPCRSCCDELGWERKPWPVSRLCLLWFVRNIHSRVHCNVPEKSTHILLPNHSEYGVTLPHPSRRRSHQPMSYSVHSWILQPHPNKGKCDSFTILLCRQPTAIAMINTMVEWHVGRAVVITANRTCPTHLPYRYWRHIQLVQLRMSP